MLRMKLVILERLFIIFFILMIQPPPSFSSDEMPSQEIIGAAQEGIRTFLKVPRRQNLHKLGFLSQKAIDEAVLGEGFRIFTLPPDRLLSTDPPQDIDSLVLPTNMWQFLIVTEGKATALLTVDLVKNRWTAVSIGGSGLAAQLEILLETWPASAGYRYRLIKVYQAKSDLIEILQGGKIIGLVPFTSARIATGLEKRDFNPLDLHDPAEMIEKLRPIVRMNIQTDR